MSAFKDLIREDAKKVFLNTEEFSELHMVNGKEITVQIDENEQIEREKRINQHVDGIFKNQKLIYVLAEEFGPLPKQGALFQLDRRKYIVVDAVDEDGIYSITLEANRA